MFFIAQYPVTGTWDPLLKKLEYIKNIKLFDSFPVFWYWFRVGRKWVTK